MRNDTSWQQMGFALSKQALEMNSPRTDGFTAWEIKKQFWEIKDMLDYIMTEAPTFAGEEEWLQERQTKKAFDKMGNR